MNFTLKKFETPLIVTHLANIHYFEFTEEYHTMDDYHDFHELVYVDKGEINVKSQSYTGKLKSGEFIIHKPNELHSLACTGDAPNIIIIGFKSNCSTLNIFSNDAFQTSAEHKRMLADILREGMSVYKPPYDTPNLPEMQRADSYPFGADQMIKLKLEMLLITLIRDNTEGVLLSGPVTRTQTPLAEIKKYIDEHYCENIQLDNICFIFGTNKTSLCKSFKAEYGVTVLGYINSLKLKEAKHLLRQNKISITQISEKLGFTSIHYFCKFFKKATGASPMTYSNTIRSKLNI